MNRRMRFYGLSLWALLICVTGGALGQPRAWESLGPEGGRIMAIAQDPANVNVLVVAPYSYPTRLFKSTNRGATWSPLSTISEYVNLLAYDPKSSSILYACSYYAIYRSTDAGLSWTRTFLTTDYSYYAYDIAIDPVNTANIHLSCDSYDGSKWVPGYMKSTNSGLTWTGRKLLTDQGAFQGVAVDQVNPNTVYLGGYTYVGSTYALKIFRSTDGGTNFVEKTGTMGGVYVYDVTEDPLAAGKLLVITNAGVYRSTNSGESWTVNSGYVPAYRLAISKANTSTVYASTFTGVPYKSTDGGNNWTTTGGGISGSGYSVIYVESGTSPFVFYGNNSSVFRSTNGGTSWLSCCGGINCASITALRNAPSAPATLFAAFYNNALFKTTVASSATVTWQQMPDFYSCVSVEDVAITPTNPDKLYALEGGT